MYFANSKSRMQVDIMEKVLETLNCHERGKKCHFVCPPSLISSAT